jgi:hypothetical protein
MEKVRQVAECSVCVKATFEKPLKLLREKLLDEAERGVLEGPRSGMLFPSLEAAEQQAQAVEITHFQIVLGIAQRLKDVPIGNLEHVRKEFNRILDATVTAPAEEDPDGKSQAAGENGQRRAAG